MWAALSVQPLKVKPWPPAAAAAKPPPRRHSISMVVQGEETGGLGQAVVSGLKSTEPQQYRNAVKPKTKTKPPPPPPQKKDLEEEQQQQQLSGCDVLMALQRATAQKAKKNKQKKRAAAALSHNDATREKNRGNSDFSRCSRPLCIKPEWRDRLQQLARRLEEFAQG